MRREDNIEIFENTQQLCEQNRKLMKAIYTSNMKQKIYLETNESIRLPEKQYERPAQIIVSKKRTLEAAKAYVNKMVCVLNFASASNPGGGVTRGSTAQEEAICRCSTLYKNLTEEKAWNTFYAPHRRQGNPLHTDDCIYTPEVVVFKSDTVHPKLLPEDQWYKVNVLTCAAPNLRERPSNRMNPEDGNKAVQISMAELQYLHEKRMRKVLDIAAKEGNKVIVLGAFGCGAFSNPPDVVATAMKTVVQEYRNNFEIIEFAVYCSSRDDSNYRAFQRKLGRV